jgi:hypothetical protein
MLERALQRDTPPARAPAPVRDLVGIATEVADALHAIRLSAADQDRIFARSLAILEDAVHEQRRGWQRALHLGRPAPALLGGAALTLGAAVIGWALLHGRRSTSHPMAA